MVATNNGVYFSWDSLSTWTPKSNGLSGDQLIVKRLGCLGSAVIIVTHGGCYYTADLGDSWIPLLPGEKFNSMLLYPTVSGLNFFVMGESGYYSTNFSDFYAIDLSGISGEVISIAATTTHVFIGTYEEKNNIKSGGVYKLPIDQLNTAVPGHTAGFTHEVILEQNYPNPFTENTAITYNLLHEGFVSLKVHDFLGRETAVLLNEYQIKGKHTIRFNANRIEAGIYYYVLEAEGSSPVTKKMIVTR